MKDFETELRECGGDPEKLLKKHFYICTVTGKGVEYAEEFRFSSEEDLFEDSNKLLKELSALMDIAETPAPEEEFECEVDARELKAEEYFKADLGYRRYIK